MAAGDLSQEILAQVRARLREPSANVWTDSDLYAYLNEAQLDLCDQLSTMALFPVSEIDETVLVDAQNDYSLPADFLRQVFVYYKSYGAVYWPMLQVGALGEGAATPNSNVTPSEEQPYYRIWNNEIQFAVGGVTQAGSEKFTIFYIQKPTDMGDSTDPLFGKQYAHAIVEYAVSKARETVEDFDEAQRAHNYYLEVCGIINARYRGNTPHDGPAGDPTVTVQPGQ